MSRDYAKKKSKSKQTIERPSTLMWFIAFMLIAIFVLGLYYLHHFMHTNEPTKKQSPIAQKQHLNKKSKEPIKFEFYTSLPNMENAQPTTVEHQAAQHENEAPIVDVTHKNSKLGHTANKDNNTYVLQIASFKEYHDADDLKAKLLLSGFNATVQKATVKGTTWYRVLVGPYTSLKTVKTVQGQLSEEHIASLLLGVKTKN